MLYKKGPRYYHASYIVLVKQSDSPEYTNVNQLHGHYRISETSKKVKWKFCLTADSKCSNIWFVSQELLIVEIYYPEHLIHETDPIKWLENLKLFRASEMTMKRFNFQQDHWLKIDFMNPLFLKHRLDQIVKYKRTGKCNWHYSLQAKADQIKKNLWKCWNLIYRLHFKAH